MWALGWSHPIREGLQPSKGPVSVGCTPIISYLAVINLQEEN
jgi:hypothetical protein